MVGTDYMTEKPARSGPVWRWFARRVVPQVVDGAGGLDMAAERVALAVRARPLLTFSAAAVGCAGAGWMVRRWWDRG